MTRPRALIVEDNPTNAHEVMDILSSLNHDHDWAPCQDDARGKVARGGYAYVLLDLAIPTAATGAPRVINGVNLAREIHAAASMRGTPIIVMTCHSREGLEMSPLLMTFGVRHFITKPFDESGKTLDALILDVVEKAAPARPAPILSPWAIPILATAPEPGWPLAPPPATAGTRSGLMEPLRPRGEVAAPDAPPEDEPRSVQTACMPPEGESAESQAATCRKFAGGELVISAESVELCGVPVVNGDRCPQIRAILEALSVRMSNGRYQSLAGPKLARLVDSPGGQDSIAGSVRDFRRKVAAALGDELGLEVGREDVIVSGVAGYRFADWIQVRRTDEVTPAVPPSPPASAPSLADRILVELQRGEARTAQLASQLGVSETSVKRELIALRDAGKVEYSGPAKTGGYRLRRQAST